MDSTRATVLVVDDDESVSEFLTMLLEPEFPVRILVARTRGEAKELFLKHQLALVIMDGRLQDGHSLHLIEWMRETGFSRPIIAHSSDPDLQAEMKKAGCSHELQKPSKSTKDIVNTISKLLPPVN